MVRVALTYPLGPGRGNVRADWVVVLDYVFTVEPVFFIRVDAVRSRIRAADVSYISVAAGACGHGLEIIHALSWAPVASGDAEDGREDRLADVSVGAPDL